MKIKFILGFLIFLTSSNVYSQSIQPNQNTSNARAIVVDNKIYYDQVIVKFKEHPIEFKNNIEPATYSNIKSEFDNIILFLQDISNKERFNPNEILFYKAISNCEPGQTTIYSNIKNRFVNVPDLSLAYIIRFPKPIDIDKIIHKIKKLPEVEYAHQPVQTVTCTSEPNDPEYENEEQWYLDKIEAQDAWNFVHGSSSIKIAVLDAAGINWDHEDLISNYAGGDDDEVGSKTHGTMVAGVAAAVTNNDLGIACLGWNTKFLSYKFSGDINRENFSNDIKAAADDGANIMVITTYTTKDTLGTRHTSCNYTLVEEAIKYADSLGVIIVASAGNEPMDKWEGGYPYDAWPAQYPNVIGVSATTSLDSFVTIYNYSKATNELVDVAAPGKFIYTTSFSGSNDTYFTDSGTSFSTPLVAALAGLILSSDPELTSSQVQSIITSTADEVGQYDYVNGWNKQFGFGRINAYEAIKAVIPDTATFRNQFTGVSGYPGVIKIDGNTENSPHDVLSGYEESISVQAEAISQTYNGIKYTFDEWFDQSTTNPRTFYPNSDTTYTAYYDGKPVNMYYYNFQFVGDPEDPIGLIWNQHPNTNVTKYEIWRKVKHNDIMGDPELIATNNSRSDTTHTDYDYSFTDGYTDDLLYYDIRSYYSTEATYSDPEWSDAFGEEFNKRALQYTQGVLPEDFSLSSYPNPFNPSTTISFSLAKDASVTLIVFNVSGQQITELFNGHLNRGIYKSIWDGSNKYRNSVAGGIYFAKLVIESDFGDKQVLTQKMLFAK